MMAACARLRNGRTVSPSPRGTVDPLALQGLCGAQQRSATRILPILPHTADCALEPGTPITVLYLILIAAAGVLLLLFLALRQHELSRRDRAVRRLLDGADALESQLRNCRQRMQQLRTMLVALPEEMSASADSALAADEKIDAGLRDLLAHRLWISQKAPSASRAELEAACAAIEQSRQIMHSQLARLDAITGDLAQAQSSARSVAPRGKANNPP